MDKPKNLNDAELAEFLSAKGDEMMRYVTRDFMRELHKDELSVNQYSILKQLDVDEEVPMGHLAESLNVTAPAITIMVDKLEQDHYVERIRDSHDRRIINVRLTKKGREAITKVRKANLKLLSFLVARMTPEEKKSWALLYEKITSLLKKRAEELKTK